MSRISVYGWLRFGDSLFDSITRISRFVIFSHASSHIFTILLYISSYPSKTNQPFAGTFLIHFIG